MARGINLRPLGTLANVFLSDGEDTGNASDYREVPASDRGNRSYSDRGGRGTYQSRADQFPDPAGLKWMDGYGADKSDLSLGFIRPSMSNDPAFDLVNYKLRSSVQTSNSEDFGNTSELPTDFEFRSKNIKTRGLFKRPHLPTER